MNEEQSKYYEEQFISMQPNPKALLSGSIARSFFEKSRLPLHELKEIWYLQFKIIYCEVYIIIISFLGNYPM